MPALKPKKKAKKPAPKCRVVRTKRTGRRKKVCTPRKRAQPKVTAPKAAPVPQRTGVLQVPSPAALPITVAAPAGPAASPPPPSAPDPAPTAPAPAPAQPQVPLPDLPEKGTLSRRDAERLLWRAGFGPRPGDADRLAGTSARAAVEALTRVSGDATLTGAAPRDQSGNPIDPHNVWGHDHLWWLDRMVRGDQPLVERMTLLWHDWFATTDVDQSLALAQNATLRRCALGSFLDLANEVTKDPAMLVFLNGIENRRGRPNENYARELMELFTLGADRGAYTETDVRELARALTGWRADWTESAGLHNFRFDPARQDTASKTLWAGTPHQRSGALGWQDAVRACVEHPLHASFFVLKLWSAFIPTPPSATTQAKLEQLYVTSGWQIRPVLEAILLHPDLYDGAPLVKAPVVYTAGLMRARGRSITTNMWTWRCSVAGQELFRPPNVAGWKDHAWLDTATVRGRWYLAYEAIAPEHMHPWQVTYSTTETPAQAVDAALAFWDRPHLSPETLAELERFAAAAIPAGLANWELGPLRCTRQNALRHLVVTCPDFQTS
jgi:hypothetical protein